MIIISRKNKSQLIRSIALALIGGVTGSIFSYFLSMPQLLLELFILGFFFGLLFGLYEYFFALRKLKKFSFPLVVVIQSLVYSSIIVASIFLLVLTKMSVLHKCTIIDLVKDKNLIEVFYDNNFQILFTALIGLSLLINFVLRVSHLLGPNVLLNYFIGKYHTPVLEERIFLFLDVDSSTSIAESLGTKKYSMFLKDFFSDLSEPLYKTRGRVYQYVGDEAVVVWKLKQGLKNNNALRFYFYVQECIDNHKHKYLKKYGFIPRFKAGVHFGETIITEVGEIKKEIVYHGDLINTTARIRTAAKKENRNLLVSEEMLLKITHLNEFQFEDLGLKALNGKKHEINLYSVEPKKNYIRKLCPT